MLTIYIPTYNRINHLKLVLNRILSEIDNNSELDKFIIVKVFNNASTDGTREYLNSIAHSNLVQVSRDMNVGPVNNILDGINQSETKYLWILGDDDIPILGLLVLLQNFLIKETPNLVYLPAKWYVDVFRTVDENAHKRSKFIKSSSIDFIKRTGIKITFISSYVIDCEFYQENKVKNNIEIIKKTNFPNMEFLAPALLLEGKNYIFNKIAIHATGNTNFSYPLIETFGIELPKLILRLFEVRPDIAKKLISNLLIGYLPSLIYYVNFDTSKNMSKKINWSQMQIIFSKYINFWIFIYPLKFMPKFIAIFIVIIGRSIGRK